MRAGTDDETISETLRRELGVLKKEKKGQGVPLSSEDGKEGSGCGRA